MKTLYIECNMGAAGDMLCAAFADLFDDKKALEKEIASIGLPSISVTLESRKSSSIMGTYCNVLCNGEAEAGESINSEIHSFRDISSVISIINELNVSDNIKSDAVNIYNIIAEAESKVHGVRVSEVHFHELGMLDAVADVVLFCYLIDKIKADRIIASPINVGNGNVKCAHGLLPVPAPATAEILKGIPFYKSEYKTELCTPTGAAILKYFADEYTDIPLITAEKIGIGVGRKELSSPNIIRAFLSNQEETNTVTELNCNIDDMTGEEISFACDCLLEAGALDVFTTPVFMKKNRPAFLLTVICNNTDKEKLSKCILKNTKTLGIRINSCSRLILSRNVKTVNTPLGEIEVKYSSGYDTENVKIEYESIKNIARSNNLSFLDAEKLLYKYIFD